MAKASAGPFRIVSEGDCINTRVYYKDEDITSYIKSVRWELDAHGHGAATLVLTTAVPIEGTVLAEYVMVEDVSGNG